MHYSVIEMQRQGNLGYWYKIEINRDAEALAIHPYI